MNENFNETVFNCITSVNALMTSNEVAKDDKAVIKLNRFKKWLNEFAAANGMNEVKQFTPQVTKSLTLNYL